MHEPVNFLIFAVIIVGLVELFFILKYLIRIEYHLRALNNAGVNELGQKRNKGDVSA